MENRTKKRNAKTEHKWILNCATAKSFKKKSAIQAVQNSKCFISNISNSTKDSSAQTQCT